uniref:MARVEL domain-containing protein n=1 Tax=Parascaris univalens TaxID=6257 RepID=A0A915C2S4_PARUN
MMRRASWCISKQSILKWLQIVCLFIIDLLTPTPSSLATFKI